MVTKIADPSLSSGAIAVLGQLFVKGPTWDGNLVSKQGRSELVDKGLAERWEGWQWLTPNGVKLAVTVDVKNNHDKQWYEKQNQLGRY